MIYILPFEEGNGIATTSNVEVFNVAWEAVSTPFAKFSGTKVAKIIPNNQLVQYKTHKGIYFSIPVQVLHNFNSRISILNKIVKAWTRNAK